MITAPPRVQVRAAVSLRQAASFLLADLESHRLTVSLAAAPDRRHSGHKIRCVEQRNPAWYRQLCAEYITRRSRPRKRKPKYVDTKYVDTMIKRRHVLRALHEISHGGGAFLCTPSACFRMSPAASAG